MSETDVTQMVLGVLALTGVYALWQIVVELVLSDVVSDLTGPYDTLVVLAITWAVCLFLLALWKLSESTVPSVA